MSVLSSPPELLRGVPLLLGHRGHRLGRVWSRRRAGTESPDARALAEIENTRAAFDRALALGCDGMELDVHRTADGHLVIHHDSSIHGLPIADTQLAALRRVQPSLMTLPVFLRRYGERAWLDLEIKGYGLEADLVEVLRHLPPARGYVVSCFDPEVLLRMAALAPDIPLCFNLNRPARLRSLKSLPITWVAPHERLASRWYLDRLHAAGFHTLVWTVNRERKLQMLLRAGVHALVSDDPCLLASLCSFRGNLATPRAERVPVPPQNANNPFWGPRSGRPSKPRS